VAGEDDRSKPPSAERLRIVLAATRSVVSDLSLTAVLQRIVAAAREVSGARYAALGVLGPSRTIEQLVHVGFEEQTVARIGRIPAGHGMLGALLADSGPIRVANVTADPRFTGFPPGHPGMTSFLGVPIRSHGEAFGNLYLGDRQGGEFTADDEELVLSLAATAGVAIQNAWLYEESRQRQRWLRASGEVSRQLLDPAADRAETLQGIADRVRLLADAELVALVLPEVPEGLRVAVASGPGAAELAGRRYPAAGTVAQTAISEGRGLLLGEADPGAGAAFGGDGHGGGPLLAVPLIGEVAARGAILATRSPGGPPFTAGDLDMATTFANQAALALELVDAQLHAERLAVLEDRDRIAQDLHDHVVQRLYAAGLSLRGAADDSAGVDLRAQVTGTVAELDDTIRQIRSTIFELERTGDRRALPAAVRSVVRQLTPLLPAEPELRVIGPVDRPVDGLVVSDVEAVLREALVNVIRHARATAVEVRVEATDGSLEVAVADDGRGMAGGRRSGLENLEQRAARHGGRLEVQSGPGRGTRLRWTIPVPR
jgi:signal transduction histidine kinase